jgi:hypothetical protein
MATNKRFELELSYDDPYKATRLFLKAGRAFFGRWRPLPVKIDGDEQRVTVLEGQEGQLNTFAGDAYGNRALWPVIAHANKIDDVASEVVPGLTILIPKLAHVVAALQATIARGAQVELES